MQLATNTLFADSHAYNSMRQHKEKSDTRRLGIPNDKAVNEDKGKAQVLLA